MSSQIGYFEGKRLHIREYDENLHANKVVCSDGHILVAKRGAIKCHHFAHKSGEGQGCFSDDDGKTDWHIWWQERIRRDRIEFQFRVSGVLKIADSINVISRRSAKDTLSIVEFQNSVMSAEEMAFRESYYTRTDLLQSRGVPHSIAELTWIFNLSSCNIDIEHIFGDIVCFKWMSGTKYMLKSRVRTFYDFGKQDLIQILHCHRPEIAETKFVGRLTSIHRIDNTFFDGILKEATADNRRLNTLKLADYKSFPYGIDHPAIEEFANVVKDVYFSKRKISDDQKKKLEECSKKYEVPL